MTKNNLVIQVDDNIYKMLLIREEEKKNKLFLGPN